MFRDAIASSVNIYVTRTYAAVFKAREVYKLTNFAEVDRLFSVGLVDEFSYFFNVRQSLHVILWTVPEHMDRGSPFTFASRVRAFVTVAVWRVGKAIIRSYAASHYRCHRQ